MKNEMKIADWTFTTLDPAEDYRARKSYMTAKVDFGTVDSKGRKLGCRLIINESEAREERTEGYTTYPRVIAGFYTGIQAERDGETFGASFPKMLWCETLEEAKASLLKRAAQSCKRAAKNAVTPLTFV